MRGVLIGKCGMERERRTKDWKPGWCWLIVKTFMSFNILENERGEQSIHHFWSYVEVPSLF